MNIIYMLVYFCKKLYMYAFQSRSSMMFNVENIYLPKLKRQALIFYTLKVCNEGTIEGECHLLFTCLVYSAIHARYDDILRGSDNF